MLSFTLCIVRVVQPGQLGHYVSSTPSASIAVTELVLSMISPSFAAVLLGSLLSLRAVCWASKERVLLENVSEFRVELGKMTTGRKSSQVPQLKCVGGTAGCAYTQQPRVVHCLNTGIETVQFECKPTEALDPKYELRNLQVSCEGYDHPEDPYILRDSCGLEYELHLAEQKQQEREKVYRAEYYSRPHESTSWNLKGVGSLVIVVIILSSLTVYGLLSQRKTTKENKEE